MTEGQPTDEPQRIAEYTDRSGFGYTPARLRNSPVPRSRTQSELTAWGLDADTLGRDPFDVFTIDDDVELRRYQYDVIYYYRRRVGGGDHEYYPVEFRVFIDTVGSIPESLKRKFRVEDNPRLQRLFDSGPYAGHMTGFDFHSKGTNEEDDEIAADEVTNLGVPQFEVLIHQEGSVVGHAGGFFDPFALGERVPANEEWKITRNEAREEYEFRPQSRARERLEGQQKRVYLNGEYIGRIQPTRGAAALKFEYSSKDNTWKESATGLQMWSRQKFIDQGVYNPQAIAAGGKVYKVDESDDRIDLVATKPSGFDPTPSDEVPAETTEQITMVRGDSTTFDIRFDEGSLLGRYDTPTVRDIERGTDLLM